ncbi:hypothetical protein TWF281_006819 [Arthrobotrys megalospora]
MFNHLENELLFSPGKYGLAHLALGFQPRQNNDCNTALKSLLYDQLSKYPDYAETILEVLGGEFVQKLGSTEVLQDLIEEILHFHRPVFLFIDGIDELSNDAEIRKFLAIMERILQNCTDVRLFISCRPEELIQTKVRKLNAKEIYLSQTQNRQDIGAFALHPENLDFLVQECGYDNTTAKRYLNAIVDKADGMFLYAKLLVGDLTDLLQGVDIETLIKELPTGLDQAYERSLQRIASLKKPLRRQAKRVFRFLLGGASPLRVLELQQAVLVEPAPSKKQFQVHQKCSLGLLCGSLVDIMNDDTVCLVHSSLKEYLLEKDNILGLRQAHIHRNISTICYDYLSNYNVYAIGENSFENFLRSGGLVFLSYACMNLTFHLREGVKDLDPVEASDTKTKTFVMLLRSLSKTEMPYIDSERAFPPSVRSDRRMPVIQTEDFSSPRIAKIVALFTEDGRDGAEDTTSSFPPPVVRQNIIAIIQEFNAALQNFAANCDSTELQSIIRIYGPPFRCTEVQCVHFYLGFLQMTQKVQHIASHRMEFKCPISTCPYHEIGFSSSEYLKRHDSSVHRLALRTSFSERAPSRKARGVGNASKPTQKFSEIVRMIKDALSAQDTATASNTLDTVTPQVISGENSNGRPSFWHRYLVSEFADEFQPFQRGKALQRICWEGKRQFFTPDTLLDYILFYGNESILNGTFRYYISEEVRAKPDECISLAVLGKNCPAVKWVLATMSDAGVIPNWTVTLPKQTFSAMDVDWEVLNSLIPGQYWESSHVRVRIGHLVDWVDDTEVTKIFRRCCPNDGALKYLPIRTSAMILLATFAGYKRLAVSLYSNKELLDKNEIECILARMVSSTSISSQEQRNNIRDICIDLQSKGAPFWKAELGSIIGIALPASLVMEESWSTELFVQGLGFCLDLGVSPTALNEVYMYFRNLEPYIERRAGSHLLQPVDLEEVLGLVRLIMEMGVSPTSGMIARYVELGNSMENYFDDALMSKCEVTYRHPDYPHDILHQIRALRVRIWPLKNHTMSTLPEAQARTSAKVLLASDYVGFIQSLEPVRRSAWTAHQEAIWSWMEQYESPGAVESSDTWHAWFLQSTEVVRSVGDFDRVYFGFLTGQHLIN